MMRNIIVLIFCCIMMSSIAQRSVYTSFANPMIGELTFIIGKDPVDFSKQ